MDNIPQSIPVTEEDAGIRLDKFLASHTELTRQRIQQLLKDGHVLRDQFPVMDASRKVKAGECYTLILPAVKPLELAAESHAINIIFEDEHLLVINKAAGMVVHPAAGVQSGTLVNALLHHCGESLSGIGGVSRPGIVHRLDKDTSGLMLVAKHDAAHQGLSAQLQDRTLSRTYHALCWSVPQPPAGTIDAPIARSPQHRKKMAIVEQGKPARTHYQTLKLFLTDETEKYPAVPFASLIECRLETGRTHQIRVHLSDKGCGLIGDTTYGMPVSRRLAMLKGKLAETRYNMLASFSRQALHALRLRFIHPMTQQPMQFDCPYPEDIEALLACLEN